MARHHRPITRRRRAPISTPLGCGRAGRQRSSSPQRPGARRRPGRFPPATQTRSAPLRHDACAPRPPSRRHAPIQDPCRSPKAGVRNDLAGRRNAVTHDDAGLVRRHVSEARCVDHIAQGEDVTYVVRSRASTGMPRAVYSIPAASRPSPSTRGVRPVATRRCDPAIVSSRPACRTVTRRCPAHGGPRPPRCPPGCRSSRVAAARAGSPPAPARRAAGWRISG